jgi:hypothetical protein
MAINVKFASAPYAAPVHSTAMLLSDKGLGLGEQAARLYLSTFSRCLFS